MNLREWRRYVSMGILGYRPFIKPAKHWASPPADVTWQNSFEGRVHKAGMQLLLDIQDTKRELRR